MLFILLSIILLVGIAGLYIIYRKALNENKKLTEKTDRMVLDSAKQAKDLRVLSERISSIALQLVVTINESNTYSSSMLELSDEMHSNNRRMSESTGLAINEIREIVNLVEKLNGTAGDLKKISSDADITIRDSLKDISAIIQSVEKINSTAVKAAEQAEEMHESSGKIINILKTVRDISDRTQLLAFNAAIESARAGEAGKGFSIVAGEINKLSEATREAVDSISQMVSSIEDRLGALHEVSNDNKERAREGVEAVRIVEKRLGDISASFYETLSGIEEIGLISRNQDARTRDIEKVVGKLEKNVNLADQSVIRVHSSVEKQHGEIQGLNDMVSRLSKSAENLGTITGSQNNEPIAEDIVPQSVIDSAIEIVKKELLEKISACAVTGEEHTFLLQNFLDRNKIFEAAWTNDSKGRFICSLPPSGIANASEREWFRHAISGEDYVSKAYFSAITGESCVTLSFPLRDNNSVIFGVIGFDISGVSQGMLDRNNIARPITASIEQELSYTNN